MAQAQEQQQQQQLEQDGNVAEAQAEAESDQLDCWQSVDKLQEMGVNMSDITKLKQSGINTLAAIRQSTLRTLNAIKGFSEAKITKILDAAGKLQQFGFATGREVMENKKKLLHVSTGSKQFDQLLGGGIESQSITECFGEFRTGKTQLCHTLCVTAQLPTSHGGGNGKVIYIDTEGTFRPQRIVDIATKFGVDPGQVLDNITYARAHTSEHQMELLVLAAAKMIEEPHSLIIVDSATALYRVDFVGRGQLAERQNNLGQFLSLLQKLSEQFNCCVVITNQVVADPGANAMFVADAKKPVGGHIMAHASTTRLYFRKGRAEQRIVKIYDSPSLPESECIIQLGVGGILDVAE
jgi:meiotic recombination protein DMC1